MMNRAPITLAFAIGAIGAIGCAGSRQQPPVASALAELGPVPAGAAQVCVVRPDSLSAQTSMAVRDNGRLVGATRGSTFFCWLASVGDHQITSIDDDTGPMMLRAQSGARYWLHQDVTDLGGALHAHLDWVEASVGLELLEACEARVHVAVPGHDDETSAQPIAPASAKRQM